MTTHDIIKELRAAFEREPRVHVHRNHIHLSFKDGLLLVDGEVGDIAAKKLALRLGREFAADALEDRLRVAPAVPVADGALRDAVAMALAEEPTLRNCAIRVWVKGQEETIRDTQPESGGAIHVSVEEGVVALEGQVLSLSHRRLAGVLAWWSPGCRDVINKLEVVPPEEDSDEEIDDALRLVLEKDRSLPAGQIRADAKGRVVTLEGLVFRDEERQRAESDAWYVQGVGNVINRIEVRR